MLRQSTGRLHITAPRQGLHELTEEVTRWLHGRDFATGLLTLFCRHTSASLLIQENAAPGARRDLESYFSRVAPEDATLYSHNDEGLDDMPAHLRTSLTQTQLSIPVEDGRLLLGTWQGIYLFEHRDAAHTRHVVAHITAE